MPAQPPSLASPAIPRIPAPHARADTTILRAVFGCFFQIYGVRPIKSAIFKVFFGEYGVHPKDSRGS